MSYINIHCKDKTISLKASDLKWKELKIWIAEKQAMKKHPNIALNALNHIALDLLEENLKNEKSIDIIEMNVDAESLIRTIDWLRYHDKKTRCSATLSHWEKKFMKDLSWESLCGIRKLALAMDLRDLLGCLNKEFGYSVPENDVDIEE